MLCFRNFVSGSEKVYGLEGEEYQDLPSIIVCLTVPKRFVGEPFFVSQKF